MNSLPTGTFAFLISAQFAAVLAVASIVTDSNSCGSISNRNINNAERGYCKLALVVVIVPLSLMFSLRCALGESDKTPPYPLLELFLWHECVERDVMATTLISSAGRSNEIASSDLARAYRFVSDARSDCATDRSNSALQKYDLAISTICSSLEPKLISTLTALEGASEHRPSCIGLLANPSIPVGNEK